MIFSGITTCKIDANNRLKLPTRVLNDFSAIQTAVEVTLCLLPEGSLGIFPLATWEQLTVSQQIDFPSFLSDLSLRDRARWLSASSLTEEITNQGRLTLPPHFLKRIGMNGCSDAVLVGDHFGYELWSASSWEREEERMFAQEQDHAFRQRTPSPSSLS